MKCLANHANLPISSKREMRRKNLALLMQNIGMGSDEQVSNGNAEKYWTQSK